MDHTDNRQPMMDMVLKFFREEQWNYQKVEGKPIIRAGFRGEHGTWVCFTRVDEEKRQVLFHSLMGLYIPPQFRILVMEYLTRINFVLCVGNFEMDLDRGEVRFRTSLEAPDGALSLAVVRSMAYTNVHTIDHYYPGVMAVLQGSLSPEAALARVEIHAGGDPLYHP